MSVAGASPSPRGARHRLVAAGLVLLFVAQAFFIARSMSPVADEPPHIAAGLSYLATGAVRANPQHPPLMKELSAVFAMIGGVRWPDAETARLALAAERLDSQPEWQIGASIIADNGPDRVLFWARLPMILVAALLGVAIFGLGRALIGGAAALGAVFLYAFDPVILAHAGVVATDVGMATFGTLFFLALFRYVRAPGPWRLVVAGLALGAALGAKFSAVMLVPIAAVLLLAATLWSATGRPATLRPRDPCRCGSGKPYRTCHGAAGRAAAPPARLARRILGPTLALGGMVVVAAIVVQALYLSPGDPWQYLRGLRRVNADHDPNYLVFMAGQLQARFAGYFAVVYLLKEPLASILLAAVGAFVLARSREIGRLEKLCLCVPPAIFFAAYTLRAENFGARYLIPMLPFTLLLGGLGLAALLGSASPWKRGLAVLAMAWVVLAAAGIHPDQMSYFNEAACLAARPRLLGLDGGSKCGRYWLDDHNVDWGQGTRQLKQWLDRHAPGRPIKWAHFVVVPPSAYGIRAEAVDFRDVLRDPPAPGLYVISAHLVARWPVMSERFRVGTAAWLRRTAPTAVVAHSLYVYDVP